MSALLRRCYNALPHRRLRAAGILGMNARNLDYIGRYNPRRAFSAVDDKIITKELALAAGVHTPRKFAELTFRAQFKAFKALAEEAREFVIKPARGAGGGGILVVKDTSEHGIVLHNNKILLWPDVRYHINNILSGMFSLGGGADRVLVEERLKPHPVFAKLAFSGIPDVRIIVFRGIPVAAMLRLPTAASEGKANLHMGGVGAGMNIVTGETAYAVQYGKYINVHPDFRTPVAGCALPLWEECLLLAARIGTLCDLRYIGADLVIDEEKGPMMLEMNARPGLAIQIANGRGLLHALEKAAALMHIPESPEERVRLGKEIYAAHSLAG